MSAVVTRNVAFAEVRSSMSGRSGLGAPVRDAFFKCEVDGRVRYPLAELMSSRNTSGGGRGGRTRVALYLALLWVASGAPHETERPANFWATLLGLNDPEGAGSRVVRSTWRELHTRGFVNVVPGPYAGAVPVVQLLREDGSRRAYSIPTGDPREGDTYRRVPENAFQMLLPAPDLNGAGLAMYLVALRTAERAQTTTGLVFPAPHVTAAYGIGASTRQKGLRNLEELSVLDVHRGSRVDDSGGVTQRRRQRNTYDLHDLYARPAAPTPAPSADAADRDSTVSPSVPGTRDGRPVEQERSADPLFPF